METTKVYWVLRARTGLRVVEGFRGSGFRFRVQRFRV